MNAEQLRFFYNEVMGLFDWSEDDEAVGIDSLEFVRRELTRLRNNKPSRKTAEIETAAEKLVEVARGIIEISKPNHGGIAPFTELLNKSIDALAEYEALK